MLTLCLAGAMTVVPATVWSSWSFAPAIFVPLVLLAVAYACGLMLERRRDGVRREGAWREAGLFAVGFVLLVVALVSPLCRLAASLASAHMVQHLILVALAPPLLAAGAAPMLSRLLPRRFRSDMSALLRKPAVAAGLYGAAIWFWHIPHFYTAALTSIPAHLVMYGSLLAAALLFWSVVLGAARSAEQAGMAVLILLGTLVHTGMLGALLSMSRTVWYPVMSTGSVAWGLTPLEDQQLAGLIMWVPMGLAYLVAALAVVAAALANLRARTS